MATITLTPAAAEQVVESAKQADAEKLALRIAARQNPDGSMEYGIGFDEMKDDDLMFNCSGIAVIMEPQYEPMLQGTTVDFVEIEPGQQRFIIMNPNDANYTPPNEDEGGCGGCGSGGCGS